MITLGTGAAKTFEYWEDDAAGYLQKGKSPFAGITFKYPQLGAKSHMAETFWNLRQDQLRNRGFKHIVEHVADWYVLGAIVTGALGPLDFDPKLLDEFKVNGKLKIAKATPQVKAIKYYNELTDLLASTLNDYFFYACSRESRYLDCIAKKTSSNATYAVYAWKLYYEKFGNVKTAEKLMACFDESKTDWSSDFGGYLWHQIASTLHAYQVGEMYGTPFTAENFIDLAVSLEHNNGNALNKINWPMGSDINSWWEEKFSYMCDAQANDLDLLAKTYSSTKTRNLYRKVISNNA